MHGIFACNTNSVDKWAAVPFFTTIEHLILLGKHTYTTNNESGVIYSAMGQWQQKKGAVFGIFQNAKKATLERRHFPPLSSSGGQRSLRQHDVFGAKAEPWPATSYYYLPPTHDTWAAIEQNFRRCWRKRFQKSPSVVEKEWSGEYFTGFFALSNAHKLLVMSCAADVRG